MSISRKDAIQYIYNKKGGTLEDLKNYIGEKHLRALQVTGLIQRGQEKSTNTWVRTNELINFVEAMVPQKKYSVLKRLQNFINHSLTSKSLCSVS